MYENTIVNTVAGAAASACGSRPSAGSSARGSSSCAETSVDAPPEAVWAPGREDDEPNTLVVLTVEARPRSRRR